MNTYSKSCFSYPNTDITLICFDTTSKESLKNVVNRWAPEVNQYCPDKAFILGKNNVTSSILISLETSLFSNCGSICHHSCLSSSRDKDRQKTKYQGARDQKDQSISNSDRNYNRNSG